MKVNSAVTSLEGGDPAEDAGEVENRLSLNVGEFPMIGKWEDGKEYPLTALKGAKLRQISPGEFEVVSGVEAPEEAPAAEEPMRKSKGKVNPAVETLED